MRLLELYEYAIAFNNTELTHIISSILLYMLYDNSLRMSYSIKELKGYVTCMAREGELLTSDKDSILIDTYNLELEHKKYKQYMDKQLKNIKL